MPINVILDASISLHITIKRLNHLYLQRHSKRVAGSSSKEETLFKFLLKMPRKQTARQMPLSAQLPLTPMASSYPAPPQIHSNSLFSTFLDLPEPCKGLSVPFSQLQSTVALAYNLISSLSVGNEKSETKMVPATQLMVQ